MKLNNIKIYHLILHKYMKKLIIQIKIKFLKRALQNKYKKKIKNFFKKS